VGDDAFQVSTTGTEFLQSKPLDPSTGTDWNSAWNSTKPHDWTKPVY
jgi:hypothetical protein